MYSDKELEGFNDLFSHEMFQVMEQEFKEAVDAIKEEMVHTEDNNRLQFLRGQIGGYRRFLGYRSFIAALQEAEDEDGPEV